MHTPLPFLSSCTYQNGKYILKQNWSILLLFYITRKYFPSSLGLCIEECSHDSECTENEVCLLGRCHSDCNHENHCQEGFKCLRNSCLKSCSDTTKCLESQYCHSNEKVCKIKCMTNEDCLHGEYCHNGACILDSFKY